MGIRADSTDRYLEQLRPPRTGVMAEMEDVADRDGVPIVSWETGRLLASLAGALDASVLEVGTAIGYSALHVAEALGHGRLTTLERDPDRISQARDFLGRAGVDDRVEIVEGDALETIAGLSGPFDMLFLDASTGEYQDYLELAEPLLTVRALVVVDNVLMSGQVAGADGRWAEESVRAQREFNERMMHSDRWRASVLPVGDGVLVASGRT
jgi:predicted O-methyltransferase YrrM